VSSRRPIRGRSRARWSLRRRLVAWFCVVGVVPFLSLSVWFTFRTYQLVQDQAIAQQRGTSGEVAVGVSSRVSEIDSILRTGAEVISPGSVTSQQRSQLLSRVLTQDQAFVGGSFIDSTGRETERISESIPSALLELRDLAGNDSFTVPVGTGSIHLGAITFNRDLGVATLEASVPYRDALTGEVAGVLLVEVRAQSLLPAPGSVTVGAHRASAYLLTGDGMLIAHPIPSLVLRGLQFLPERPAGFETGIMGDRVVLASQTVDLAGQKLLVVTESPVAEALAPFYRDSAVRLIGVGIALIGAVGAGALVADGITRSLRRLSQATSAVTAAGVMPHVEASGSSEVVALGEAFNEMGDEIERQRKETEQYAERLKSSNQQLERFAFVAAHDLQEPLRKVLAFGDLLALGAQDRLGDKERDYLARMQGAAGRMRDLISNLLEYSRISTRAQPFGPVDLDSVVNDVWADLSRTVGSGARMEADPLPTIEADRDQMYRLFLNLVGNALKFRHPDRPPVVQITGRIVGAPSGDPLQAQCEVLVSDNGIGFEAKYQEQIFDIFQRLHGRGEYEGTGMGLAICRRIVERHGGTITAEGHPGQGATITVRLLLHPDSEEV
jgi:signal transduction histidine kinase